MPFCAVFNNLRLNKEYDIIHQDLGITKLLICTKKYLRSN